MYKYGMHEPYGVRDEIQKAMDADWPSVLEDTQNSPVSARVIMEELQFQVELPIVMPVHGGLLREVCR